MVRSTIIDVYKHLKKNLKFKILLFQRDFSAIKTDWQKSPLFFKRTRGLFRECFLGEKQNAPTGGKCYILKFIFISILGGIFFLHFSAPI